MKIVLATPLYPPDIEPAAIYCKELARRLATAGHSVVVATYGKFPEEVPRVAVMSKDKQHFLFIRIITYTVALWKATKNIDVIYAQNGASVELPLFIISTFSKKPIVLLSTDKNAIKRSEKNFFLNMLAQAIRRRAHVTISHTPPQKPEILPFETRPEKALAEYETAWNEHVQQLTRIIP